MNQHRLHAGSLLRFLEGRNADSFYGSQACKGGCVFQRKCLLEDLEKEEFLEEFARDAAASVNFGSNRRASAEYRNYVTKVLIKRCLGSIKEGDR